MSRLFAAITLWVVALKGQLRARGDRRQADERIRLLAHALHSASDCISITDTADRIVYVNEAFLRTYEYEERELLGQHIGIVRSPDNVPEIVNAIPAATRRDGWRGVVRNRSKTGRVFPISLATSMVHDERGRIVAAVGVARDVSKETAAEEVLHRTESKYRAVVENANDIIFTVDREGYCLSMNRAGREVSEPFFTTKGPGKGTGLGLATVYGIVKQTGGYITITSDEGLGTAVTIYLAAVDAPTQAVIATPAVQTTTGIETVLLVEDEIGIRELMRKTLDRHGYTVLEARDVADAVALGEKHVGPIHLLLTDIVMPVMNGPNLAQRIVRDRPAIKVLYVSGFPVGVAVGSKSLSSRATFLAKPFAPATLVTAVRECLDK